MENGKLGWSVTKTRIKCSIIWRKVSSMNTMKMLVHILISLSSVMVVAAEEVDRSRRTEGRLLFDEGLDFNWNSGWSSLNWFDDSLLPESELSSSYRILRLTAWICWQREKHNDYHRSRVLALSLKRTLCHVDKYQHVCNRESQSSSGQDIPPMMPVKYQSIMKRRKQRMREWWSLWITFDRWSESEHTIWRS